MIETVIKTSGCYLGIFDLSSAIHREESLRSIFENGESDAKNAKQSSGALWYINEQFLQRTRRGEILVWIVLFDGCFKAHIKVLLPEEEFVPAAMHSAKFLAGEVHYLNCPTGSVAVASLHDLGNPDLRPTIEVEPGLYQVGFIRDEEQEAKHEFWDEGLSYPVGDGPDWYLILKRIVRTKS